MVCRAVFVLFMCLVRLTSVYCQSGFFNKLTRPNGTTSYQLYAGEKDDATQPKFLTRVLNIITVNNQECLSVTGRVGVCYTAEQCGKVKGLSQGTCALGFGVCCIVQLGCGGEAYVNNTYFDGPSTLGSGAGVCSLKIRPSKLYCQHRLQLDRFVLNKPQDSSGPCIQDQFAVTGVDSQVPVLCGTNNDQHIILNTDGKTDPITLYISAITPFVGREWRIRIINYVCGTSFLAPPGCLQYLVGVTGQMQSFNYLSNRAGNHLSNLDYSICIRNEVGYCGICYQQCGPPATGSFSLSGTSMNSLNNGMTNGADRCENDYIVIPCGGAQVNPSPACGADRFCGGTLNPGLTSVVTQGKVCSVQQPFTVNVITDNAEAVGETEKSGFCLLYEQIKCS